MYSDLSNRLLQVCNYNGTRYKVNTTFGCFEIKKDRPLLILEAGVNHEGSLERAIEMIHAAAEVRADAIKFQSYKAETLASRDSPAYWDQTKEPIDSQFELFKKYDSFNDADYRMLAECCKNRGIIFCSTPFDDHFVDLLDPLMPFFKVASADITNFLLLEKIAAKGKPVILSTGASYLAEVDEAVRFLRDRDVPYIALLHCVLEYPTKSNHANLRTIPYLKSVFPECTIGYSDHVAPHNNCQALLVAWLLGAQILEKHFTLDKSLPGNDHYHAMDPEDVRDFRTRQQEVADLLGASGKTCLPWEMVSRKQARRSLVTTKAIPAETVITKEMLTAKRPGKGIPPMLISIILGKRTKRKISADTTITWDDID